MGDNTNRIPSSTAKNTTMETPEYTTSSNVNRNGRRWNRKNDASIGENRCFAGETLGIYAVMVLMSERLNKGTSFEKFQEKLANYFLKNLSKTENVIILIS